MPGHPSHDQFHESCKRHGYHRKEPTAVSEIRLASRQDQTSNSSQELQDNSDIPVTTTGRRGRPPEAVAGHLQAPAFVLDKRRKRDALRVGFIADKEVVKEHAQ